MEKEIEMKCGCPYVPIGDIHDHRREKEAHYTFCPVHSREIFDGVYKGSSEKESHWCKNLLKFIFRINLL